MINNRNYPYFKDSINKDTINICKWYPIVYNLQDKKHIKAVRKMLYPPMGKNLDNITMCGGDLYKNNIPEMASYYGTTVHLHGSNSAWRYDGYPNSHYYDRNSDDNRIHLNNGGFGGTFGPNEKDNKDQLTHYYTNDFPEPNFKGTNNSSGKHGAILWYHDHAMMHTAAHVYAGLLAPYIIKGEFEEKIFSASNEGSKNDIYTNRESGGFFRKIWNKIKGWFGFAIEESDIPLVINDKSFTKNGFLFYNTTASETQSDSTVQPEFFGNTIVVNGKVWPNMPVEGQTYRFRILNTCSSRTLSLALATSQKTKEGIFNFSEETTAKCWQIGTESGLMPNHVEITSSNPLTLAPGERADVLIDFSQIEGSKDVALLNFAPNSPYGNIDNKLNISEINDLVKISKDTISDLTNVVMQFKLNNAKKRDSDDINKDLDDMRNSQYFKDAIADIDSNRHRKIPIVNVFSLTLKEFTNHDSLKKSNYGKLLPDPRIYPLVLMNSDSWDSEKIEREVNGHRQDSIKRVYNNSRKYEVWRIVNLTPDMHPIHIHLNRFEVIKRTKLKTVNGEVVLDYNDMPYEYLDSVIHPSPHEIGWKDVVQVPKGQVTYIRIKYKLNRNDNLLYGENSKEDAQFVYHCHILEHEDVSMMRRLVVKQKK